MWLQSYVLPLIFLLSTVSGIRNKQQPINFIQVHMDVNCDGRSYTKSDLDTAAFEACSRSSKQFFCRDYISPYYLKKCIPAIPNVSLYKGPYYTEQSTHGPLLMWPLPKRSIFERTRYYAIIYWNAQSRQCKVVGAIKQTIKTEHKHNQCVLRRYDIATHQDSARFSSHQREEDIRHPQTNSFETSPAENQNETPYQTQPVDTQPELKSERFSFTRKFRQSSRNFLHRYSRNSKNVDPADSGTKNGPER